MSIQVEFQMLVCGQAVWSLEYIFSLRELSDPLNDKYNYFASTCHACKTHSNHRHCVSESDLLRLVSPRAAKKKKKKRQGNCPQKWLPENLEQVYGGKGQEVITVPSQKQRKRMTRGRCRLNQQPPCIYLKNSL